MAKKKYQKLKAEDHARHERIMSMVRERIAYHEQRAIELEAERTRDER